MVQLSRFAGERDITHDVRMRQMPNMLMYARIVVLRPGAVEYRVHSYLHIYIMVCVKSSMTSPMYSSISNNYE